MAARVTVVDTPELGDRSYVVDDGEVALVVDPQRDTNRVEAVLDALGVRPDLVVETHIHNDYVTGGLALARRHGIRYAVNADDPVAFDRTPVRDGDELAAGRLRVRVVATPGHTVTHLAYVVTDTGDPEAPPAVFTGGSLLYGSVGRTDLVDPARTTELAHAQYHSAHRLAAELPDASAVFPTHGFGSFCSSGPAVGGDTSTIGAEKARNDALTADDEDGWVERLVAALTAYPTYYVHMAPRNLAGPVAPDPAAPAAVDPGELAARIAAGGWVVDLRDRTAYAADHVAGTVGIELGTQFATYLGWVVPWGAPLTLLGETPEQVAAAARQLVRIGVDELAGAASGPLDRIAAGLPRRAYPRATFADLAARPAGDLVLDVRRDDEWRRGHLPGALHLPLAEIVARHAELPTARLWVHCAAGFRAGIAASLLDRAGHAVVHVDDDFAAVGAAGLSLVTEAPVAAAVG